MATSIPPAPFGSAPPREHQRRGREVGRVLVLNATYEPINVCTVRRAVVLLLKEKAEMIERSDWQLHSATSTMSRPMVIRLVDHVVPRSKGGPSSWENIVASCAPCNRRKGSALLRQSGMHLARQPRTPSP